MPAEHNENYFLGEKLCQLGAEVQHFGNFLPPSSFCNDAGLQNFGLLL
jgi:hypothetical protein